MSVSVLPILELPHPTLRQRARKVRTIGPKTLRLAYDMIDTMHDAAGVGLAANQVGSLQRVIVIQLPEEEETRIYVNPEIVHREGQREVEEGCLSVPGYKGLINRSLWVKFSALDHTSKTVKLKAEELLSQAIEHEVDHLDGILYLDHLESHDKLVKIEPESEQTAEGPQPASDATLATPATSDTPASVKVK
jgi:peptide deformylase